MRVNTPVSSARSLNAADTKRCSDGGSALLLRREGRGSRRRGSPSASSPGARSRSPSRRARQTIRTTIPTFQIQGTRRTLGRCRTVREVGHRLGWAMGLEKVADGVWLLRGDFRGAMNIYFLEDGDGVVQFDAGTKGMRKAAQAAGEQLGGIKRVVLGHAHADHRGTAPYLGAPVFCHPDEVADAESDAAIAPYMDLSQLPVAPVRWIYPTLLRRWDGGAGEDRRHRHRGRRGRRLPRHPLPRPRAGADRALARERPGGAGQRRRLPGRLGAAETAARGRGQRPPPRLGLGPRSKAKESVRRLAALDPQVRRHRARAAAARREPARRRWSGRPRSTERGGAAGGIARAGCHKLPS